MNRPSTHRASRNWRREEEGKGERGERRGGDRGGRGEGRGGREGGEESEGEGGRGEGRERGGRGEGRGGRVRQEGLYRLHSSSGKLHTFSINTQNVTPKTIENSDCRNVGKV